MTNSQTTARRRSQLFQMLALAFAHPLAELHEALVSGNFGLAMSQATHEGLGLALPIAKPESSFVDFEAAYIDLFQIGREGFKRVLKARTAGRRNEYNPTDLSYANEAERSSDIITASWVDDELIDQNRVEFQCLKVRDGKKFQTFLARVEWPCRRIIPCYDPLPLSGGASGGKDTQEAIDAAADKLNE